MKKLGKSARTPRGFGIVQFKDALGESCSLQNSSLSGPCVWLGVDKPIAKVIHGDAHKFGLHSPGAGYVDYPIPPEVRIFTRMHLNRKQVAALIGHLKCWLENDTFTR